MLKKTKSGDIVLNSTSIVVLYNIDGDMVRVAAILLDLVNSFLLVRLFRKCYLFNSDGGFILEENEETRIKRSDFPSGFLFGTGTSAYQVEGAYLEDAKSLSNWDVFCHSLGCGENGENGDIADDHYHMFLKDIELMHSLGIQAYRFSVSWARIHPRGRFGKVNPAGIMFYNKIIDNLILKGIEPFVTIHHVEFPQELEDIYGSWLNPEMQEEFIYFADACFKSFGDRVKYWITINEPLLLAEMAYELGVFPPFRCSGPFGNCLDGNSDPKQGGSIGLTVNSKMYEPLTNSELDYQAARRAFVFQSGWTLDPLIFGDYPEEVKEYLGYELPSFSHDEKNFMMNSIDFIGINHYSTTYAKDCTNSSCSATENCAIQGFVGTVGERDGVLIGEHTAVEGSYVVPRGMEEIVNLIKIRYNNKPMFITENGYSSPDVHEQRVDELINDVKRIEYHASYLASLAKSIREGADVRGYFAWSFMDSYEWLKGYNVRYGLHYVDRQTLTRTPKLSAKWYKNFLTNNTDLVNMEASREKLHTNA
ncbi:putative beta-glucosidase [Helianthus anomalus]